MPRCFDCHGQIEGEVGMVTVSVAGNTFKAPAHPDCVPDEIKDGDFDGD